MAIEIEKKYRLTDSDAKNIRLKIDSFRAEHRGRRFEINELYSNDKLLIDEAFVRIRVIEDKAEMTFKKAIESKAGFKTRLEYESHISDPKQMRLILEELGLSRSIVYEKRREIWSYAGTEIVIDELPFGNYLEIEGSIEAIENLERLLDSDLDTEDRSYPLLTRDHGDLIDGVYCSRFPSKAN